LSSQLVILGCSSATPTTNRNPTAQLLNIHERFFLIDCGEGTQMQLRRYKLRFAKINHIFISHLHGDHYLGLMGFLSSLHLLGRTNELHLYCHAALKEIIDVQLKFSETTLRYPLTYHFYDKNGPELLFEDEKVSVHSIVLNHRISCRGFLFREKPGLLSVRKGKLEQYRIPVEDIFSIKSGEDFTTEEGKIVSNSELTYPRAKTLSYAFCSDTCYDESILDSIKEVDLLYHEATFMHSMQKRAKETYHSTAREAALMAQKAGVKKLLIGHFSARYADLDPLLQEAKEVFENTELAEDGKTIKF
jgi:ribonuclease Z